MSRRLPPACLAPRLRRRWVRALLLGIFAREPWFAGVARRLSEQVNDLAVQAAIFGSGLRGNSRVQVLRDTDGDADF